MLRNGGFDASINFGTDAYQNMADGKAGLYMFGHGASLLDPYRRSRAVPRPLQRSHRHRRGRQPVLALQQPRVRRHPRRDRAARFGRSEVHGRCRQGAGIYWRDQIDVPIIQWLHRIAYNQHYWKGWPTAAEPRLGENGAFWAHTGMLVVTQLKATGAQ